MLYLLFTSDLYTTILILFHWLYIALSVIEPDNKSSRPFVVWDDTFIIVFTIETFVQGIILFDMTVKLYTSIVLA